MPCWFFLLSGSVLWTTLLLTLVVWFWFHCYASCLNNCWFLSFYSSFILIRSIFHMVHHWPLTCSNNEIIPFFRLVRNKWVAKHPAHRFHLVIKLHLILFIYHSLSVSFHMNVLSVYQTICLSPNLSPILPAELYLSLIFFSVQLSISLSGFYLSIYLSFHSNI